MSDRKFGVTVKQGPRQIRPMKKQISWRCPFNTLNDAYHHGGGGRVGYPHGEEHGGQHEPQHQQAGARTLADSFINNLQPKQENLY